MTDKRSVHASEPRRGSLLNAAPWIALGIALVIPLACPMAFTQTNARSGAAPPLAHESSPSSPSFDVATIKPHPSIARTSIGIMNTPDGLNAAVMTLPMLVQYAYGLLTMEQVSAAPDWSKDAVFDIQAKMSEADVAAMQTLSRDDSQARRRLMMQALLADRFKLKVHPSTKEVPVYGMVVAKAGSKLVDAATDTNPNLEKGEDGKPWTGVHFLKDTSIAQRESTRALADLLSQPVIGLGRRVLDKTGLTGTYDFTLHWSIYSAQVRVNNGVAGSSMASDDAPSIFLALQEIGLKLQSSKAVVDTIVIDRVERPSEN